MQLIIDSAFSLIFFRKFLERVQADVKLDFYLAVLDLRKVRGVTRIRERATKIWERYCDVLPVAPSVQRHLAQAFQPNSKGKMSAQRGEKFLWILADYLMGFVVISYGSIFNAAVDEVHSALVFDLVPQFTVSGELLLCL